MKISSVAEAGKIDGIVMVARHRNCGIFRSPRTHDYRHRPIVIHGKQAVAIAYSQKRKSRRKRGRDQTRAFIDSIFGEIPVPRSHGGIVHLLEDWFGASTNCQRAARSVGSSSAS